MNAAAKLTSLLRLAGIAMLGAVAATPASAQFSDNKIKIGVLTDISGLYADNTGMGSVVAAQMAIEDAGGAVNGVPVELITGDHQNKADIGATLARKWYDTESVDAIVDVPNSAVALAVQGITREKNRVVLFSSSATSDLTGKACSPNGAHWTYDTYALSKVVGSALVQAGQKEWFFITADYAFGHTLEAETTNVVKASGGSVLGSVRVPANSADYSSFLLQAQSSKAGVVGLATAGADTQNAIKQAAEFGLSRYGKKIATLLMAINEVHSVGLGNAGGILLTSPFYWDLNDETRAFSKRFFEKRKIMPSLYQAGVYSAVAHYLKAMKSAGTDKPDVTMAEMRKLPINDFMTKNGTLREDGRVIREMHVFEVKKPGESKAAWDYYKHVRTVPGEDAFRPLSDKACSLLK